MWNTSTGTPGAYSWNNDRTSQHAEPGASGSAVAVAAAIYVAFVAPRVDSAAGSAESGTHKSIHTATLLDFAHKHSQDHTTYRSSKRPSEVSAEIAAWTYSRAPGMAAATIVRIEAEPLADGPVLPVVVVVTNASEGVENSSAVAFAV